MVNICGYNFKSPCYNKYSSDWTEKLKRWKLQLNLEDKLSFSEVP